MHFNMHFFEKGMGRTEKTENMTKVGYGMEPYVINEPYNVNNVHNYIIYHIYVILER